MEDKGKAFWSLLQTRLNGTLGSRGIVVRIPDLDITQRQIVSHFSRRKSSSSSSSSNNYQINTKESNAYCIFLAE
jgi:hypothetical protein